MNKSVLIGAAIVLIVLVALVALSSAHVRRLREEGQFGTPVETA